MTLRSGDRVLIRPIRPEDKDGLVDGSHRMTPESRYRRFFSPMNELGARRLRYLTEVDHRTHGAFIATDPSGEGLGTTLLEALAARAHEEGVERFTASVLANNSPMLELFRKHRGRVLPVRARASSRLVGG